jgi:hypothetical protein
MSDKKSTQEIEILLLNYTLKELNHNIAVPRCEALGFEADILSVTKTAFLHEFEIKISRSDFLKESTKKKWKYYENNKYCPNYFWYVCEEALIKPDEIKDFAGLIYVTKNKIKVVKNPKRLHSGKCNMKTYRKVIRSLSFKLLNESEKLFKLKENLK